MIEVPWEKFVKAYGSKRLSYKYIKCTRRIPSSLTSFLFLYKDYKVNVPFGSCLYVVGDILIEPKKNSILTIHIDTLDHFFADYCKFTWKAKGKYYYTEYYTSSGKIIKEKEGL